MKKMSKKGIISVLFFLHVALLCTTAVAASSKLAAKPVRMAYLQSDLHHLPLWVALDNGLFTRNGTKVEIAGAFRSGPDIMAAFSAGAVDMAYVGLAPATTAVANGTANVVVVSQVNAEGSAVVVASRGNRQIHRLQDLEGKTVAVPGLSTVQDFLLKQSLKKQGVKLEKVKFMAIKPPEMINALRNADVDAFIAWEPYPAKAYEMGVGRNLATSRELWPGHPCCVLVADAEFFAAHPEQVRAVLQAHNQGTEIIRRNPGKAAEIAIKYTGMDRFTVGRAFKTVKYSSHLGLESVREYVTFLSDLGYIRKLSTESFLGKFIRQ